MLAVAQQLNAQDAQFSQFFHTPHQVNPALIGLYDGDFRAGITYREQWSTVLSNAPFRTIMASFDVRQPIGKGDYLGIGGAVLRDEVHVSNFTQDRGHLGVSYRKQLSGSRYKAGGQYLIAGGQVGYGQNAFDAPNVWFSDQFDASTTTIGFPTGEDFTNQRTPMFIDVNAGVMWYNVFDDHSSIYIGAAAHHLNTPNISFIEGGNQSLDRRYVAQIGGEFPLSDALSMLPAAIGTLQGEAMNVMAGGNFRYTNREWREVALRMGGWAHVANKLESGVLLNAFIVTAVIETERITIGASYDINTSSLSQATNARGAFELSLIYTQPAKARKWQVNCPRF